jgi:hypothetical protein
VGGVTLRFPEFGDHKGDNVPLFIVVADDGAGLGDWENSVEDGGGDTEALLPATPLVGVESAGDGIGFE